MVKFSHLRLYCKAHCSGRVDYGKQGQSLTNALERIIDYVYYCHSMQRTPICHCLSVEIEFWLLASVWFKKKKKASTKSMSLLCKDSINKKPVLCKHSLTSLSWSVLCLKHKLL